MKINNVSLKAATRWSYEPLSERCILATSPITLCHDYAHIQLYITAPDQKTLHLNDAGQVNFHVAKNGIDLNHERIDYINTHSGIRFACLNQYGEITATCPNENLAPALWDVIKLAALVSACSIELIDSNIDTIPADPTDTAITGLENANAEAVEELKQLKQRNQELTEINRDLSESLEHLHNKLSEIKNHLINH